MLHKTIISFIIITVLIVVSIELKSDFFSQDEISVSFKGGSVSENSLFNELGNYLNKRTGLNGYKVRAALYLIKKQLKDKGINTYRISDKELFSRYKIKFNFKKDSSLTSFQFYKKSIKSSENFNYISIRNETDKNFKAYRNLKYITRKLPHRMAGTENGREAEEFIYNKLKSYGYDVKYQKFYFNLWERKKSKLTIYSKGLNFNIKNISFAYTPLISDVRGRIVDVGDGTKTEFFKNRNRIHGKVVLVNLYIMNKYYDSRGRWIINLHRSDKARLALKYGAIGIIFINRVNEELILTGTVSKDTKLFKIPAVCISKPQGQYIRYGLRRGIKSLAKISLRSTIREVSARNIIATLPGLEKKTERIIIGGHLDTWDVGQGAVDNGMGSFAILEIARIFKKANIVPKRTVQFIFWMAEEEGILGSKYFLENEIKNNTVDSIKYYLNIDMAANPIGYDYEGRMEMAKYFKWIGSKIQSYGVPFKNLHKNVPSFVSDNIHFAVQGVPVLQMMGRLNRMAYLYYHSHKDSIKMVNENHLNLSVMVMGMTLYGLSMKDEIEAKRMSIGATEKFYKKYYYYGVALPLKENSNWKLRIRKGR